MITTIQRFSLNDGPGIRTTIFFKGCPMRCAWCHNPEAISPLSDIMKHSEKCIGCRLCVTACTYGALSAGEKDIVCNREVCKRCGACANVCYTGATEMSGLDYSAAQIMEEVLQDSDYYRNSGGGVTLSGGEPLLQVDLAEEVLTLCREKGIHTAIESCLYVPWQNIESLLPLLDLVMADIKLADREKHEKWTGVSNERILDNMRHLSEAGMPMIVRTPVIPNVNDNEEEIAKIAAFAAKLPTLKYYELLNYNPLGESKYRALGRDYAFSGTRPLSKERMNELLEAARSAGLKDVRVG